ncbi:HesA/MoeB/ThiF family protein [Candidatus Nitrosotenuis aquarius]|uniref:HesA/MoeB/ThiF family protein n=1 Tax=Candidatus Nitrosotenuis aquarius TaxID=1846278 RepID=UPI0013C3491E|nr:ThiF family adenylyltransferase [Candidatus Nitrosotenuis aquarius]
MNPTKILITKSDIQTCRDEVLEHAKDCNETGFAFFGEIRSNKVYVIKKIVLGGPRSERGHVSFTTDEVKILEELKKAKTENPKIRYLGDGHSHPWPTVPSPSGTDINQLSRSRKTRPWFVIAVFSSTGEVRFFGLDADSERTEIPYQIVPDGFSEESLLERIDQITDNDTLRKSRVGIIGCGSLASSVVSAISGTGICDYIVCDMDKLATVNVIRHLGGIYDIGRSKTQIIKRHIESHNPLAVVQTVEDDLIKNRELLRSIIESCDIIVAASGNPELNYHTNVICCELGKKAVYCGIYAGAKSAYVFCVSSGSHACFDCIFSLTSAAIDQNTLRRKYGLEEGELKAAQGMFADITIPGSMMVKMTLWLLLGKEFIFNLVRYYDDLRVEKLNVPKKDLCATCNYENWLKHEEEKTKEIRKSHTKGLVKKLRHRIRGLGR